MREALFYEVLNDNIVQCSLCPHNCSIKENNTGFCRVRKNINGVLCSLVYGIPVARSVDPIEKKPLFHFYPQSKTFSIATMGCNMHCKHCQNADISQVSKESFPSSKISVEEIIKEAKSYDVESIAYTYTEPTIYYEYAFDIAKLAHKLGIKNIFVTNGYINKEPLEKIAPYLDAANIDLKGMSEQFYKKVCGANLQPVLDSIKRYYDLGIWIEITTLIIPGYNDKEQELKNIAGFIADIDPNIPWHVTGFYPTYKLTDTKATNASLLDKAVEIGKENGLNFIYQGNIGKRENTYCPQCRNLLVQRNGFNVSKNNIKKGICSNCHHEIPGKWSDVI